MRGKMLPPFWHRICFLYGMLASFLSLVGGFLDGQESFPSRPPHPKERGLFLPLAPVRHLVCLRGYDGRPFRLDDRGALIQRPLS